MRVHMYVCVCVWEREREREREREGGGWGGEGVRRRGGGGGSCFLIWYINYTLTKLFFSFSDNTPSGYKLAEEDKSIASKPM